MKKLLWIFAAALCVGFAACSEEEEESEFANWEERNVNYIDSIARIARANTGTAEGQWRVMQTFHLSKEYTSTDNQDYVFAKIIEIGEGTDTPQYTDSVSVSYRGRLIPSSTYKDGYVFDQNYYGDLDAENKKIMVPTTFTLNGVVDGWGTALQEMHEGDYWRLYIPQSLGYGSSTSNSSIPAYSTLIFDVYVQKVYRSDK